jgi:hypothetical protein
MTRSIDTSVAALRGQAIDFDLLAYSENSGWLAEAAKVIAAAADRIEELEHSEVASP